MSWSKENILQQNKPGPRVDFIKVRCTAQIIGIALFICALCPTFDKLFTGVEVYEIDPRSMQVL